MKKVILFLSLLLLTCTCFIQTGWFTPQYSPIDTSFARYVPMTVGNLFTFICSTSTGNSYTKLRVTKDTVAYGHRYFYYQGVPGIGDGYTRYDSTSGLLLQYYPGTGCGSNVNDKIIDSIAARINDSLKYCTYNGITLRRCTDTINTTLFNTYNTKRKRFYHSGVLNYYIAYAMNIGLYNLYMEDASSNFVIYDLKGCKVNGIVYGDTNIYHSVSGNVYYTDNSQPASGGYVKAIKLDRATGNIITYDSVQILSNGSYSLTHVPQDTMDIGVYPNSTTQNDWVHSYYPSTIFWQSATRLYVSDNLSNINTGVIRMTPVINPNLVSGKVVRLTDFSFGNLKDAYLYAKSGNTFVRYGVSDGNGDYYLPALPSGSLKIICDRMGFAGDSAIVSLSAISNIDSINFYLNSVVSINRTGDVVPFEYKLYQNYPNPFNPITKIKYQISNNKLVILRVYDLLGREVAELVNEKQAPGVYEISFDVGNLPSGIYFYKLEAGSYFETKNMVLIK